MKKTRTGHLGKLSVLIVLIIAVLCGCERNIKPVTGNDGNRVNYNNIYSMYTSYNRIWFDGNTAYYSKYGFNDDVYYYQDEEGRHRMKIRSNDLSDGDFGQFQAFGDYVYVWYNEYDEINTLYRYSKNSEKMTEVFSTDDNIECWTVFDGALIYTAYSDRLSPDESFLYYCELDGSASEKISSETRTFGVSGDEIYYLEYNSKDMKGELYRINRDSLEGELVQKFECEDFEYSIFNFTSEYLVILGSNLEVMNIESGEIKEYDLPKIGEDISAYKNFAFILSGTTLYRIDLTTGSMEELSKLKECEAIYALNDNSVVVEEYDSDSLNGDIIVSQIKTDKTVVELFKY